MESVVIIDYGMGNLLSVKRAVEHCGYEAVVTDNLEKIRDAGKIILPGVGAFRRAMEELNRRKLTETIKECANKGTPIMGICLGMQLLLDSSSEFGEYDGLGLINGSAKKIEASDEGQALKVPNIGWCDTNYDKSSGLSYLFKELPETTQFYYVHSFFADLENEDECVASTNYGNLNVSGVIGKANVVGCQFHPEKSGPYGLRLLKNFLSHRV